MQRKFYFLILGTVVLASCQKGLNSNVDVIATEHKKSEVYLAPVSSEAFYNATMGQTPINIITSRTVNYKSDDPVFHYGSFNGVVKYNNTHYNFDPNGEIVKEAHDEKNLKVEVPGAVLSSPNTFDKNIYVTINGTKYFLLQYHFHWNSEHALNGKKFDMEVHLVNQSEAGKVAVIGVFIEKGKENKTLASIFEVSPTKENPANAVLFNFNPMMLLPEEKGDYFTYSGSLTTPGAGVLVVPYLEGLKWFVYKQPIAVSTKSYDHYREIYEEPNARPLQNVAGRTILAHESDNGD